MPLFASAQRIVDELETNSDSEMNPKDSLDNKKNKKFVPVDVKSWTIDDIYGNRTPVDVDTLTHQYQNQNLTEGVNGHYSHLGNIGSPRLNRLFFERTDGDDFIFTNSFDQFFVPTNKFKFYNTKSPYLNLAYNWAGNKTNGDDHVKIIYTCNAGKRINFGALFDYIYGEGYYNDQSTSHMGASGWASYLGDKYEFHFYYTHNHMKLAENGGITDENYLTHPEDMTKSYESSDIPTWLTQNWSKQEHDIIHFNHRYNIGFYRTEGDSTNLHDVFVPVTSIFHTFDLKSMRRTYLAYDTPDNYHTYTYLPGDSTKDKTEDFTVRNIVGLSLREGFNKWAAAGLNAYVGFEHQSYSLQDTIITAFGHTGRYLPSKKTTETNTIVGGQIIRTQGTMLHYNINAEFVVTGERSGDFNAQARGELNLPFKKDTAQVVLNAYFKNQTPSFYYRHYHAQHAWWDNNLDKETRIRIEGQITLPKTNTVLTVGVENMKNYTYFENTGLPYTSSGTTYYSNNVSVNQCSDNVQVISANLRQDFKLGILHWDNDVTYQTTTNKDVLPLPTISLYSNLYIKFKIAKVLGCEFGGDVKFFTEYYAPDYSPLISQFMLQNKDNKVKVGNYPLLSVYANFDLKRTRFYVQYYHFNQSDGRYLWLPGYPMNPTHIRFGLSWNFYD